MLVELTTIPAGALPTDQFRDHLRLGTGLGPVTEPDAALDWALRAAMAAIEARTGKILIEREFQWTVTRWGGVAEATIPCAPVSAISEVRLVAREGTVTLLTPGRIGLRPHGASPAVTAQGATLPVIPMGGYAQLGLVAGYGPDWSDIPGDLRQAVLLLAAHFHDYRHDVSVGQSSLPYSVNALLQPYQPMRLSLGARA